MMVKWGCKAEAPPKLRLTQTEDILMRNHFKEQIKLFERNFAANCYGNFKKTPADRCACLFSNPLLDYGETSLDSSLIAQAVRGYYVPDTRYYRDPFLLDYAIALLDEYVKKIHEDGSTDLRQTNFHDPAQCGFIVRDHLCVIETVYRCSKHTEKEEILYMKLKDVIRRHGDAMVNLGFHTPNHRWVISAALSIVYKHTGDVRYLDTINRFLMEGIDCDENGEYTERSTGIYNYICDKAFLVMGIYMNDPQYFEYARRNLNLMFSYFEPDGTVCTLNSARQDRNTLRRYSLYYPIYLYLALEQNNSEFAYIAENILDEMEASDSFSPDAIDLLMARPEIIERYSAVEPKAPAADKSIFLPKSGIARIYKPEKNMTITVMKQRQPTFLQIQCGSHVLQLRFGGAFFGDPHSQFRANSIEKTEKGYRLIDDEYAGYRSQLDEKPETSDWHRMDHSKRRMVNIQEFCTVIDVEILDDGIALDIDSGACDGILTKLEITMDPGGRYDTEDTMLFAGGGDYAILKKGRALYTFPDKFSFSISGGAYAHSYTKGMRGTSTPDSGSFTVAVTGETPHKNRVEIRVAENGYNTERMLGLR